MSKCVPPPRQHRLYPCRPLPRTLKHHKWEINTKYPHNLHQKWEILSYRPASNSNKVGNTPSFVQYIPLNTFNQPRADVFFGKCNQLRGLRAGDKGGCPDKFFFHFPPPPPSAAGNRVESRLRSRLLRGMGGSSNILSIGSGAHERILRLGAELHGLHAGAHYQIDRIAGRSAQDRMPATATIGTMSAGTGARHRQTRELGFWCRA